jgi:hypothetical protein
VCADSRSRRVDSCVIPMEPYPRDCRDLFKYFSGPTVVRQCDATLHLSAMIKVPLPEIASGPGQGENIIGGRGPALGPVVLMLR